MVRFTSTRPPSSAGLRLGSALYEVLSPSPLFGSLIGMSKARTTFRPSETPRARFSSTMPAVKKTESNNPHNITAAPRTMSQLSWPTLLRSYVINWITSSPTLLNPSLAALGFLARTKSKIFSPDSNPVLHALLKKTFYVHFCAGETPGEVRHTIKKLKSMGYRGVMMGHAREEVLSREEKATIDSMAETSEQEKRNHEDIQRWKQNTLATLELTQEGDFVALKFTGAGKQAVKHLKQIKPCVPALRHAIHEICQLAQARKVGLLFDAEQAFIQQGIENWTMHYMKIFNGGERAVVYGTYQAYAKRTPLVLAQHLDEARKHGIVLGVKLVRGAYLGSDPRELFWDTIEETHRCYDDIARCIVEKRYGGALQPIAGSDRFPRTDFVLASHNAESVRKVRMLRDQQVRDGIACIPLAYGQLMGMADHVSCDLLQEAGTRSGADAAAGEIPQAYKYLVWGTMGECIKYLFRRAQENRDAVERTLDARKAIGMEVLHRLGMRKSR